MCLSSFLVCLLTCLPLCLSVCTPVCLSVCGSVSTYKPSDERCMDRRLWPTQKSFDERAKHLYYCQQHNNPVSQLLSYLLSHARLLMENVIR